MKDDKKNKMGENKKLRAEVEALKNKLAILEKSNKQNAPVVSTSPMNPAQPKEVFKAPKNTPGRAKPGRTQSDIQIKAPRRPPMGAGHLFTVDDEQGEMFSNSYLSELKSGNCTMNNSGKIV